MEEERNSGQNRSDERVVLIHGFSREDTIAVMRAAKSAVQDPQGVAFTTSTPSNLEWKLKDLILEVREEHEYMRNNPPQAGGSTQSAEPEEKSGTGDKTSEDR